ncbi:MAG: hypothetical protein ACJA2M_001336 [Polaribacter sp.]|jgi:hypothetical protein
MTKAEEILEKHLKINDVETMLGRHGATHKAVINALNEAINYTRCCETLKSKEEINFEGWIKENNYRKVHKGYARNQIHFGDEEMLQRYNYYKRRL